MNTLWNTITELEQLKKLLQDREWRIFSGKLYYIKNKHWKKIPFIPNEHQTNYYHNRHKKNIILKARQLWFSTMIDVMNLDRALFSSYKNIGIIADDRDSAELIFRDKVKFAFDSLPEWLRNEFKVKTDRKGELVFESNHCSISVDTSFRWWTLQFLHISEYGKICNKYPEKAREIQTGALNTLAPTSEVDIESTAEWNSGYFYDMCRKAIELQEQWKELTDMDYKFHFYPWFVDPTYELESEETIRSETIEYFNKLKGEDYILRNYPKVNFSQAKMRWYQKKKEEQKEDMQREYPSYPNEAFDLAIKGSYYEKELSNVRQQWRVGKYMYDPRLPVFTHWDLWGAWWWDETAIWFWQTIRNEVRLIDYWEWTGYWMTEIASSIVNPRYPNYETHYLPHDAEVTEYSTGTTRLSIAKQCLKWRIEIVPKLSISDGINAARDAFPNCFFNEEKTLIWLSRLSGYRREYDEKNWVFRDKPKHDINSNGADAFKYFAITFQKLTNRLADWSWESESII